jgi:hypothetical protein
VDFCCSVGSSTGGSAAFSSFLAVVVFSADAIVLLLYKRGEESQVREKGGL